MEKNMALCNTLSKIQRQYVDFDPHNAEHLRAFRMLVLGDNGPTGTIRQHPTLRFNLVHPYDNVRTLMTHRVSEAYLADQGI